MTAEVCFGLLSSWPPVWTRTTGEVTGHVSNSLELLPSYHEVSIDRQLSLCFDFGLSCKHLLLFLLLLLRICSLKITSLLLILLLLLLLLILLLLILEFLLLTLLITLFFFPQKSSQDAITIG